MAQTRNIYRNSHKDFNDLRIRKLVVQILMDMPWWDVLARLHQTGNGCWFSPCGGRTSFISPTSAQHQHRNATALSAYTDHQMQRWYQARETFYIKDTQRQCCLLAQLMTTAGLIAASAQCSYSAGPSPQEGQTINIILIKFNLSLDLLKSHFQMLKRFLFVCFGQPSGP